MCMCCINASHYIHISINFSQTGQLPAASCCWLKGDLLLSHDFSDFMQPLVTVDTADWSLLPVSLFAAARGAEISVTTPQNAATAALKDSHRSRKISCPVALTLVEVNVVLCDFLFWPKVKGQMIFACRLFCICTRRKWILVSTYDLKKELQHTHYIERGTTPASTLCKKNLRCVCASGTSV